MACHGCAATGVWVSDHGCNVEVCGRQIMAVMLRCVGVRLWLQCWGVWVSAYVTADLQRCEHLIIIRQTYGQEYRLDSSPETTANFMNLVPLCRRVVLGHGCVMLIDWLYICLYNSCHWRTAKHPITKDELPCWSSGTFTSLLTLGPREKEGSSDI